VTRAEKRLERDPEHYVGEIFSRLEKSLGRLNEAEIESIRSKLSDAIPIASSQHKEQYDDRFLDTFTELLAATFVVERDLGDVHFVEESKHTRPDLVVRTKTGSVLAIECKNIHWSDNEREYFRKADFRARTVTGHSLVGLWKKLNSTTTKASKQLKSQQADRYILFVNCTMDTELWTTPSEVSQLWNRLANQLWLQRIELVVTESYDLNRIREFTGTPTAKGLDHRALQYSASIAYDRRLYRHDIAGSIAHARMLGKQKIIPAEDADLIVRGLEEIREEIDDGRFEWREDLEDIHLNIEARLREKIGDAGARLHTARSRNDQVATDVRLFVMEACDGLIDGLRDVQRALLELAAANEDVITPGYTHLQRAQPVLFAHHLLAYFEMLDRDAARFAAARACADEMPLGSGALAGVPYPIDREFVARELGFSRVSRNSVDAVSDRDFAVDFHAAAATTMMHLSRLSEEIVLWSSEEFGFVRLPADFATGSSIMPQKRNPDVAELARGRTGRVYGNLIAILTTLKGLPLAYNRDLQEDKQPLFETTDVLSSTLEVFAAMLPRLQVNRERAERAAEGAGYLLATDVADYLVRKGVPFRDAHSVVAELVRHAESLKKPLSALTLEDYRRFSPEFGEDILSLDIRSSIEARDVIGGTAPVRVKAALAEARKRLEAAR